MIPFERYLEDNNIELKPAPFDLQEEEYHIDGVDYSWSPDLLYKAVHISIGQVFTVIEKDDGNLVVVPGFHYINRRYHLITDRVYTGKIKNEWSFGEVIETKPSNLKLMVVGHARHGKDTFCELIPLKYESSSVMAAKIFIFDLLKVKYGYETFKDCFKDRVNHRAEWHELIKSYNQKNKSRLAQDIYRTNDVYCGIRDIDEFLEARDKNLFDLSIWIDASERLPAEPADSISIDRSYADIVIENNGTQEEFENKVNRLVKALELK